MKAKKWLSFLLALVMMLSMTAILTACTVVENDSDKVTVTWYDGRKALKEEKVTKGSKLEEWTPEKEGYVFTGWFEESSLTNAFNFDTVIDTDTNIFSRWRSENVEKDTRIWYIIGSLGESNWKFVGERDDDGNWQVAPGYEKLVFQETDQTNVFELTVTLRPGVKFRFVTNLINSDWTGDETTAQVGLGNLRGFEYAEGTNPEKNADVTVDSKEYGVVKDTDGTIVFEGGFEFNMPTNQWNIWPVQGSDGVYKFTLTTYPGADENNTMEWECIEKLDPLDETHDMYVTGTLGSGDNWSDNYDSAIKLTRDSNDANLWKAFITVTESDYASWAANEGPFGTPCASIKVKNNISGNDYGVVDNTSGTIGGQNVFLLAGDYCITYNQTTNAVSFEKLDYYLVGTFVDNGANVNFVVKNGFSTALTTEDGNLYTATVSISDVSKVDGYTWMGEGNIFALKVVYGCELGIKDWYGVGANGGDNYFFTAEGDYVVTLNLTAKTFTVESAIPSYTVTYYDGNTALKTETVKEGETVSVWTPEKTGHDFDGWFADAELTTEFDFTASITADTAVYAKFTYNPELIIYTVTLVDATNEEHVTLGTVEVNEGATSFTFTAPEKEDYTFFAWYTDETCETKWEGAAITADITLYGYYKQTTFTVSLYKVVEENEPELIETIKVLEGDAVETALPVLAGYAAEGWYTDAACTTLYTDGDLGITANTSLYAKYTKLAIDNRDWYLVGAFSTGSWTELLDANKFTRGENDAEGLTLYTITVTLYQGDQIKVASNGYLNNSSENFWDGSQMGFEQVKPANSNFESNADGNIVVKTNAKYTITLHIDPTAATTPYENDPASIGSSYIVIELDEYVTETVLDERSYFLVGNGQGTIKASNWTLAPAPAAVTFTRVEGTNTYELKNFELMTGDEMKLGFASSWGTNSAYAFGAYFFAKFAPTVFEANSGWDDNAKVASGKSGKYNITLTTAGANTSSTSRAESQIVSFEFELVESYDVVEEDMGWYLTGAMNGWAATGPTEWKLTETASGIWTGTFTFAAAYEMKAIHVIKTTNKGVVSYSVSWSNESNHSTPAGTFLMTYNAKTDNLTHTAG